MIPRHAQVHSKMGPSLEDRPGRNLRPRLLIDVDDVILVFYAGF